MKIEQEAKVFNKYNIEANFPAGRNYVTGKAWISLDGQRVIPEFNAEITMKSMYRSRQEAEYRAYTENGDIVFEGLYETWRLNFRENNAGRFTAALLKNNETEVGELSLELDQAGGLSAELQLEGNKMGTLTLHPEKKSGIDPIDSTNAFVIDEQNLRTFMDSFRNP